MSNIPDTQEPLYVIRQGVKVRHRRKVYFVFSKKAGILLRRQYLEPRTETVQYDSLFACYFHINIFFELIFYFFSQKKWNVTGRYYDVCVSNCLDPCTLEHTVLTSSQLEFPAPNLEDGYITLLQKIGRKCTLMINHKLVRCTNCKFCVSV
jgi:hypothetical protein